MLTQGIFLVLISMVSAIVVFLPTWNPLPGNMLEIVQYMGTLIWSFDYIIPISTIVQVLLAALATHTVYLSVDILVTILKWTRLIPSDY